MKRGRTAGRKSRWLVARDVGFTLDALAPALGALVLAAALLPLTASMLAVWSFGLIRHA